MTFTAPLGLLALLALPAVVFLHLFRNRLPERRVAAAFLFPAQALLVGGGRTRTRLLRTPSFWCELVAALLLALWLAGLSFGGVQAVPMVIVLDDTASMSARGTRDRALQKVRAALQARRADAFLSVLRTGPHPEALLDAREKAPDVEAAVRRWQPTRPRHDVRPSLDLARELAGPTGDVVFVSDEARPAGYDDVTLLASGAPATNCALLSVERRSNSTATGDEVRLRIAAYGSVTTTTLTLTVAERAPSRHEVTFVDGLANVVLPVATAGELRVELADDALAIDNVAWLLPSPLRLVGVANILRREQQQELALDRVLAAMTNWRAETNSERAQLVLTAQPGIVADGQVEIVITSGEGPRKALVGPFVIDRGVPWLHGVHLQGVVWVAGSRELPGQVLVAAGSQALMSEEPLAQGRRLWITLHGAVGNVVRAPDWPVLFANVLEQCMAAVPGPEATHVVVGSEARFRRGPFDTFAAPPTLLSPSGQRRVGVAARTVGWLVEQPGVHRILDASGAELGRFAAHFSDASESDLRAVTHVDQAGGETQGAERASPVRDTSIERRLLALLLVLVVVADWWLLARRNV